MEECCRAVGRFEVNLVALLYPNGVAYEVFFVSLVLSLDVEYKSVFVLPITQGKIQFGCIYRTIEQNRTCFACGDGKCIFDGDGYSFAVERTIHSNIVVERTVVALAGNKEYA